MHDFLTCLHIRMCWSTTQTSNYGTANIPASEKCKMIKVCLSASSITHNCDDNGVSISLSFELIIIFFFTALWMKVFRRKLWDQCHGVVELLSSKSIQMRHRSNTDPPHTHRFKQWFLRQNNGFLRRIITERKAGYIYRETVLCGNYQFLKPFKATHLKCIASFKWRTSGCNPLSASLEVFDICIFQHLWKMILFKIWFKCSF